PLIVLVGLFPQHFRLPLGPKLTRERLTFTIADALVLLLAFWYGVAAATFVAGIEGFTSSRRTVKRPSSNLFSSSIMSFSSAAAAATLKAILSLRLAHDAGPGLHPTLAAAAIALLAASIVQMLVNTALLSTLLALRHGRPILRHWLEFLPGAAPMF